MKYYKLSEVTEIIMGQAPPGESYNEEGLGVPLIGGASDLGDNYPNPKKYTTASSKLSKTGDIIMCIRATIGDLNWADKEYALGRGVAAFRVTERISASYLYYWLLSQKQHFLNMGKGATFLQITKKDIEDTVIPLVDIEEQKQIGIILDKAQTLIERRKVAIAKLDELVQAVFIDMFGDPSSNNKGWNEASIGELSTLVSSGSTPLGGSQAYKEKGIPFIRSQNILMNRLTLDDIVYIDEDTHNRMKRTWVKHNDVLLNITGASIGRVAVYEGDSDFANVNQHVCIIRLKDSILIPRFCEYMISHPNYQRYIMSFNVGGTREAFNFQQIKKFKVICPPIAIQEKFLSIIKAINKNRETNLIQLQQLESNFQALLQKAFKGELTVKDGVTV
ncbi:restriction endonuclease subunit S [Paenibacillus thailandensis]|uniref:Restriction endonuclease subunit S n=1 Tax=Paenibacillus thailandensis TaxID=393250 RepID=A0ABW5R051_9BACL